MSRQDLVLGQTVTLDNADNAGVRSWRWKMVDRPTGSVATISSPLSARAFFTPDVAGSYLVELTVDNGRQGQVDRRIAAVREEIGGSLIRWIAAQEDNEANWNIDGSPNARGWMPGLEDILRAALNLVSTTNPSGVRRSVVDFGAVGDGVTDDLAAFDACAAAVSAAGGGEIFVPPSSGGFLLQGTFTLPADCSLVGVGDRSIIRGRPLSGRGAIEFTSSIHRGSVRRIQLIGNASAPTGLGIDLSEALFVTLEKFTIWYYEVGLRFGNGTPYTAHCHARDFTVNVCNIGVQALDQTNSCSLSNGRIFFSLAGEGVGLDLDGVDAFSLQSVNIEPALSCLRIRGRVRASLLSLYLETGDPSRQLWDVDIDPTSVLKFGAVHPSGSVAPHIRVGVEEAVTWDAPESIHFGARRHYAASASHNLIENGDFHRANGIIAVPNWSFANSPTLAENTADFVTAGRSYDITQNSSVNDAFVVGVPVPDGTDYVTVCFRYKKITEGTPRLRIDSGANAATYDDTGEADTDNWRVASITCQVDPAAGGVANARIGPDVTGSGGQVRLDAVWGLTGRCAGAQRTHSHRIEWLDTPVASIVDRDGITDTELVPTVDLSGLTGLGQPPQGAIGAVLRLRGFVVSGAGAGTLVTVNVPRPYIDTQGGEEEELPLTVDGVMMSRTVFLRSMSLVSGLLVTTGPTSPCNYDIDLLGWILPS